MASGSGGYHSQDDNKSPEYSPDTRRAIDASLKEDRLRKHDEDSLYEQDIQAALRASLEQDVVVPDLNCGRHLNTESSSSSNFASTEMYLQCPAHSFDSSNVAGGLTDAGPLSDIERRFIFAGTDEEAEMLGKKTIDESKKLNV